MIWNSIPEHLSRENKKFIFSAVKQGARARDYESALQWLEDAGLILKAFVVEQVHLPLQGATKKDSFKVYHMDIGLLGSMSGTSPDVLLRKNSLFGTFHGAFVENYVAMQLTAVTEAPLVYWKSEGKRAEVDFLLEHKGQIYPLEVKAGINAKSKSLKSYGNYYHPKKLLRSTLLPMKGGANILNIPLYAVHVIKKLIDTLNN